MTSYVFTDLLNKAQKSGIDNTIRQRDTRTFFRTAAQKITSVNRQRMMGDHENLRPVIMAKDIGKMFMFFYDPKHKSTLPYYDIFPLIFPIEIYKDGFLGINLHYLPPPLRARLMDALYSTVTDRKYDENTALNISYSILSGASKYKYFKPCIKRYLASHVQSQYLNVEPRLWDAALFLPTASFKKANDSAVWMDSREIIGR